jgi:hypothetical protein
VTKALIAAKDYSRITENAVKLMQIVRETKEGKSMGGDASGRIQR